MKLYIEEKSKGKSIPLGVKFYEEFKTHFWEKLSKYEYYIYISNILILLINLIIYC